MPFCPKCEQEFREEIKICPECKVEFVEALNSEDSPPPELEVACSLSEEDEAYIIRGFLESEGIPCVLENATFHGGAGPATGLTQVRLWCRKEDVPQAQSLIGEHEKYAICSSCGHVAQPTDAACDFCGEKFLD